MSFGIDMDENNIEHLKENAKSIKETLFKFDDFMKSIGINYALIDGTLLGAYRNDCLLPWNRDIDIQLPVGNNDIDISMHDLDMFELLRAAKRYGFTWVGWGHEFRIDAVSDKEFIKDPKIAALPNNVQWKALTKTDLIWVSERAGIVWKGNYITDNIVEIFPAFGDIHRPGHLKGLGYGKLKKIKLYGRNFYAPYDIEGHLNLRYGNTWKDLFVNGPLWIKYGKIISSGISIEEVPKNIIEDISKFMEKVKSANILIKY